MRDEVVKAAKEAGFRTGTINMAGGAELSFAQPIGISCLVELERFYDLAYNAGLEAAANTLEPIDDDQADNWTTEELEHEAA